MLDLYIGISIVIATGVLCLFASCDLYALYKHWRSGERLPLPTLVEGEVWLFLVALLVPVVNLYMWYITYLFVRNWWKENRAHTV